MKRLLSAIMIAAASMATAAAQNAPGGVTYFLPKTAVQMALRIEKTTYTPGRLAGYSEIYFKKAADAKPNVSYRIVGVEFRPTAVPDSSKQFSVMIDKKHSIVSLDCDLNGVLMAINAKAQLAPQPVPFKPAPQPAPLNPEDYMSQDILSSGNLPTMARLIAQEIYDIRDSRNQLSRGEADFMPKDGEQLKLMLAQLATQEKALTQVFQGTTVKDTTEQVVTVIPVKGESKTLAFRFSHHFGLTANDDLAGAPYYVVVEDENIISELPTTGEDKKKKDELQIGVSLPGKIKLTLTHDGRSIAQYSTYAAQFGRVEMLSGALWGKKITSHIVLNPVTGNVVSLKSEPLE